MRCHTLLGGKRKIPIRISEIADTDVAVNPLQKYSIALKLVEERIAVDRADCGVGERVATDFVARGIKRLQLLGAGEPAAGTYKSASAARNIERAARLISLQQRSAGRARGRWSIVERECDQRLVVAHRQRLGSDIPRQEPRELAANSPKPGLFAVIGTRKCKNRRRVADRASIRLHS